MKSDRPPARRDDRDGRPGEKRADAARPDRPKRDKPFAGKPGGAKPAGDKPGARDRHGPSPEAKAASDRKLKKKLKKLTKKK